MTKPLDETIDDLVNLELLKARLDEQRDRLTSEIELKRKEIRALSRNKAARVAAKPPAVRAAKAAKPRAKKAGKAGKSGRGGGISAHTENLLSVLKVQGEPLSTGEIRKIVDVPSLPQKLHTLRMRGEIKQIGKVGSYRYVYNNKAARNGVAQSVASA